MRAHDGKYLFQYRRYRLTLRAPVRTAHGVWTEREGVLVRLESESGAVGYGEAAVLPWFGTETVEAAEAACREIGAEVQAEQIAALPATLPCLRNALAAAWPETEGANGVAESVAAEGEVEVGGRGVEAAYLGVAALLPAGRAVLEAVRAKEEMGFRVFKWKVGVGEVADELGLLDDLCAVLPAGAKLRLDANGAWDRRKAERWLERCADRPVEFVEQPVAADARGAEDLLRGLAEDFPTVIALDESIASNADIERWVGAGWRGVFVVKPSLLGDVDGAVAKLNKAKAAVVFSSALETAVGAKAALRVAFAWRGEPRALGFGVWPLFVDTRCDGPMAVPFLRREDVERLNAEAVWNAVS
jgi:O-succinylbenzoate synthase